MVAAHQTVSFGSLPAKCVEGSRFVESERSRCVQPIGELMTELLARYLPPEDVWQERSRIALKAVSAVAG